LATTLPDSSSSAADSSAATTPGGASNLVGSRYSTPSSGTWK
jgi:hypothetical protein